MSWVVIPRAYSAMILWSNSGKRRWYLAISAGSSGPAVPRNRQLKLAVSMSTVFGFAPQERARLAPAASLGR